jgi:subtilase family serine protease
VRKEKYVSLALLAVLCLFAITVASSTAVITNQATTVNNTTLKVQTDVTAVDIDGYTGSGIMYNTVTELRTAYDLNPLYAEGYNGRGETVCIIDAFGDPTIYQDLVSFVAYQNAHGANLPWTTLSEVQHHLHIYYPQGKPVFNTTDQDQLGWSVEITLDVDMVHAIAPGANIALVISYNDSNPSMDYAVNYAIVHHLGCDISQSWGTPEYDYVTPSDFAELAYEHSLYAKAAMEGITCFASSGDWGSSQYAPFNNALYPASDPFVTGTGGTNLFMVCNNGTYYEGTGNWANRPTTCIGTSYYYEIAGNDYEAMIADGNPTPNPYWVTTGGAMSAFFPLPWWQYGITLTSVDGSKVHPTMRCTSDVSFDSGVYGGLGRCYWNVTGENIPYIIGGTSACSPFWAALTAIACQYAHHNLGYINPMLYISRSFLYRVKAFHDITIGDNTLPFSGVPGYLATPGWDAPTGIGSPDAAILVPFMAWW